MVKKIIISMIIFYIFTRDYTSIGGVLSRKQNSVFFGWDDEGESCSAQFGFVCIVKATI